MLDNNSERIIDWKNDVKNWEVFVENKLVTSLFNLSDTEGNVLVTYNNQGYDIEKERELENWKNLKVYNEVTDEGQDYVSVKWVFTDRC